MGDGQAAEALRAHGNQLIAALQGLHGGDVVVSAVVLAVAAQQAGGDQQRFLHRASSFPSSAARTSWSPRYSIFREKKGLSGSSMSRKNSLSPSQMGSS